MFGAIEWVDGRPVITDQPDIRFPWDQVDFSQLPPMVIVQPIPPPASSSTQAPPARQASTGAPETLTAWLKKHDTEILIGSVVLFGLVVLTRR